LIPAYIPEPHAVVATHVKLEVNKTNPLEHTQLPPEIKVKVGTLQVRQAVGLVQLRHYAGQVLQEGGTEVESP
jgi:hypothetical protein